MKAIIETGKFYHGVATCHSCRQFCSEFFSEISEHFRACFRLHWADHSDLDIIGKIFFSCRTWVQMMSILVKVMTSEENQRPTLVTPGFGRHGSQWVKLSNFTLKLGELPFLFIVYNITISWLYPLHGFWFCFFIAWQRTHSVLKQMHRDLRLRKISAGKRKPASGILL